MKQPTETMLTRPSRWASMIGRGERMGEARAKEIAIRICDEFDDLLDDKNIMIPSSDREGRVKEAYLYESEYYALEDGVADILMEELGVAATSEQAGAIRDDARTAVATMQKTMKAAPEGFATTVH